MLGALLLHYAGAQTLVLALPRGGVPVGAEIARRLGAELDVILVRKLGFPGQEELAAGAIAQGGVRVLNPEVADLVAPQVLARIEARERRELERRAQAYRGDRPPPEIAGRTVILVDDGVATGATMRAAIAAVRAQHPARLVVAVPVAAADTVEELRGLADEVICSLTPPSLYAIGAWYRQFDQLDDDTVRELLAEARRVPRDERAEREVVIWSAGLELPALLAVPEGAEGLVIFAHGSGSGRMSPRNRTVAEALRERRFATLLPDLVIAGELADGAELAICARRLVGVIDWVAAQPELATLPIGLFGASTGAAVALIAAAACPDTVRAVVSRGGRPELAGASLAAVVAPTLFIVGARDPDVLVLNRAAAAHIAARHELEIVPGASHLFEEPGALATVARRAGEWFHTFLTADASPRAPAVP